MPKTYLRRYINKLISQGKNDMAESILKTAEDFTKRNLDTFSFAEHNIGLLFGNVQAGKTAQMFGIMCAAADASFPIFILLTTDNVALQKQTYERVISDLSDCGFCICGETDKQMFIDNALAKPAIIVLKKNSKVLLQWYNTLASSSFVNGNALFIIDDEADAASPNTLVNKQRVSTINSRLSNIRNASIGSIYLQVTGTPQALLLQSSISDFRPAFTCYFEPGREYLGGDYFFGNESNKTIRFIGAYDGTGGKDALYYAVVHHLVASAVLFDSGEKVCNFVIHPGVKKASHTGTQSKVKEKLKIIAGEITSSSFKAIIEEECSKLTIPVSHDAVFSRVKKLVLENEVKILLMNGDTSVNEAEYNIGSNIIIGGNVLGRGVTFPKLQTLYYTRTAKKPQADTMWQHSRMFGYDRNPDLMAVYLTRELYKLFADINAGNNSIIYQVESGMDKIQIYYPEGLNPTRKNVIDLQMVNLVTGGTNYYPDDPMNDSVATIDNLLENFDSVGHYQVSAKMILEILNHIEASDDFNMVAFKSVIKAKLSENPFEQAVLIVRRNREVTQGTGSLLSPNDRILGDQFKDKIVLTMYQIVGNHGWRQENIWVPNIKLPEFMNYYDVH